MLLADSRMEDKGEVKCIKFSLENKILAVQRTSKTVVRHIFKYSMKKRTLEVHLEENELQNSSVKGTIYYFNVMEAVVMLHYSPQLEYTQECKTKNANILGFCWTSSTEIVFITDQGIEFYQVLYHLRVLEKGLYGQLYVLFLRHHSRTSNSTGAETSVIFDIKLRGEFDGTVTLHHPVLPARSIQPYQIPVAGPAPVTSQSPIPCYLWNLQVKLQPIVNLLPDKGRLTDFLLQRRECKTVVLSVCSQMLTESDRATLPVIATVFDKLNQEYKKYLDAEQSYTLEMPQKFVVAVLMEYIRSLNQFQIPVQHYLHELVIKTLVQHNLFYTLHQFLQYHVLSDSKPLACLLLSLESFYPPAHQLSLDMLKRLSTANDEIVEVLLSKHQVLAALRFIRGIGGHDNISARKFLDAAKQTEDHMLFYTIFRFFEQRNQRLRGNPSFTPGEHCEEHVAFFKQVFGDQALMRPTTF
ncbi:hypothetical protein E2I00_006133 [Balaenoptera physalus]|uniref:Uncharacterized protein n=1 Tax=Balaenoptera physalus TaxID=9770 RepID=A0A6A1QG10_BALPH|nr:hypothetical protein E2I00_006133 [Balaenoptera physalus]